MRTVDDTSTLVVSRTDVRTYTRSIVVSVIAGIFGLIVGNLTGHAIRESLVSFLVPPELGVSLQYGSLSTAPQLHLYWMLFTTTLALVTCWFVLQSRRWLALCPVVVAWLLFASLLLQRSRIACSVIRVDRLLPHTDGSTVMVESLHLDKTLGLGTAILLASAIGLTVVKRHRGREGNH